MFINLDLFKTDKLPNITNKSFICLVIFIK